MQRGEDQDQKVVTPHSNCRGGTCWLRGRRTLEGVLTQAGPGAHCVLAAGSTAFLCSETPYQLS